MIVSRKLSSACYSLVELLSGTHLTGICGAKVSCGGGGVSQTGTSQDLLVDRTSTCVIHSSGSVTSEVTRLTMRPYNLLKCSLL